MNTFGTMQLTVSIALSTKCTGQQGQALIITQASEVSDGGWNEETEVFLYLQLLGYLLFFLQTRNPRLMHTLYWY